MTYMIYMTDTRDRLLYQRMKLRYAGTNYKQIICENCGGTWSPNIRIGGKLPRKWWVCPHCNHGNW